MSSTAAQPGLILIQRLADGSVKWIPLDFLPPQRLPVAPDAAYTVVDRADYEAPKTLVAKRAGEDLVIEVQGNEVLVLNRFFVTADVTFYPTTNIAGGAGPFSGSPLTPDSAVLSASATSEAEVWSAGHNDRNLPQPAQPSAAESVSGGSSPLLWVGLAVGGLGLAALAGGGGGSGGGDSGGGSIPPPSDSVPPQITSGTTAPAIAENSGAGQVVYTATATDVGTITYSLKAGDDAAAFSIDANTGVVRLTGNPDFETKPSYNFTVVATDTAGNSAERAVSLAINNVNDSSPITITSGGTANAINENSGAQQVVYTVTATGSGVVTYSLKAGGDAAAFSINANTGAVTLTANPDDEAKGSYSFTVVAKDAVGNSGERAVSLGINDLDEVAPTITSSATATAINENSGSGQVVYTVTSTDTGDVSTGNTTYSLKPVNDAAAFNIDANTGQVRLTANPDFETKPSYSFTVVATDTAHHSSERAVSLAINNIPESVDETPPRVDDIALSAVGAQNGILNAGDTVKVTVTMTENTLVDTSGGIPRIELSIDKDRVEAGYVTGSGTRSLTFEYTIQPGDEDKNGISIRPNALDRNGGSIVDAAGNQADLSHGPVANNSSFIVDTTAPLVSSISDNTTLNYEIGGFHFEILGLAQSSSAGNSRNFQASMNEEIDIRVASDHSTQSTGASASGSWGGSANLSSDDRVMLVANGDEAWNPSVHADHMSITEAPLAWQYSADPTVGLLHGGSANSIPFDNSPPDAYVDGAAIQMNVISPADVPVVIMTSQGLV